MITRLITIWDAIRSSLWALPLLMVLAACGLAYAALHVDVGRGGSSVWFLFSGNSDQAPQFLSNLVTAMITMATLVVSITMVVLTLAAQQLGPRLIRSFMSDRRTQATLGLFVGTVVYLLLVLRNTYGQTESVPNLAVTGGTVLVLVCVAILIFFVHHLAQSIIADNVIDRVGAQLDANVARLLPAETVEQPEPPADLDRRGAPVQLAHGGYVQAVDFQSIVDAAAQVNAVVALDIRAGHHAVPRGIVAHVTPKKAADDEELCNAIRNAVVTGRERTAVQDLEFSVRQLVEIALRALSPGINDPYTANAVLDRLTLSIATIMTRGEAQRVWQDEDGTVRLVTPVSTFEGVTDEAFNQIRQQALPAVLIRMADNIGVLLEQADEAHRPALEKHLKLVVDAGRLCIAAKEDLAVLQARAKEAEQNGKSAARRAHS
jgi:uncharacterized membrane protein